MALTWIGALRERADENLRHIWYATTLIHQQTMHPINLLHLHQKPSPAHHGNNITQQYMWHKINAKNDILKSKS